MGLLGVSLLLGPERATAESAQEKQDPYAIPQGLPGARFSHCCAQDPFGRHCGLGEPDKLEQKFFRIASPVSFEEKDKVTRRLLAHDALGAEVSPDGRTVALSMKKELVLQPGGKVGDFATRGVRRMHFSPDGQYLAAMSDIDQDLEVFRTNDRAPLGKVGHIADFSFTGDGGIAYHKDCELFRAELGDENLKFKRVGRTLCGTTAHFGPKLDELILASGRKAHRGTSQVFTAVSLAKVHTHAWQPLLESGPEVDFLDPRTSPDGRFTCALRAPAGPISLECRDARAATSYVVWGSAARVHAFDPSGRYLLFEGGGQKPGTRAGLYGPEIYVADLEAHAVTKIAPSGRRSWRWMGAGMRVVAHGGYAEVYDLSEGWKSRVASRPKEEWEGFFPVPRSAERFVMGRDHGSSRSLYFIDLPKAKGAAP